MGAVAVVDVFGVGAGWAVVFEAVFAVVGMELEWVGVLAVSVEVVLRWVGVGMAFCGRRGWLGFGGGRSLAGMLMKLFCVGSLGRSWERRLMFMDCFVLTC